MPWTATRLGGKWISLMPDFGNMSYFFTNLFFALLSAIVGAFLGWLAADPDRVPQWLAARRRDWSGRWWCIWQHPDDPSRLVIDEVRFARALGTIKFAVITSGDEFQWEGRGKMKFDYLFGEFQSSRPRARVRGTFTFIIMPQGDKMVGYFTGPATRGGLVTNAGLFTCREELMRQIRDSASSSEQAAIFYREVQPAVPVGLEANKATNGS
jgi:hypothetical protein